MRVCTTVGPQPLHQGRRGAVTGVSRGFTLIELMIVLVVLGVLLTVGIPTFSDATLSSRLNSNANRMIASIHLARSEAIKRNAGMLICASTNGVSCTSGASMESGWIVIPVASGARAVQVEQPASGGVRLIAKNVAGTTTLDRLQFPATGAGLTPAKILVCRSTPSAGSQERVISVSAMGRPSIATTTTGQCK